MREHANEMSYAETETEPGIDMVDTWTAPESSRDVDSNETSAKVTEPGDPDTDGETPELITLGDGSDDPDQPKVSYQTDLAADLGLASEATDQGCGEEPDDPLTLYARKLALALGACPVCGTEVVEGPDWVKWGFSTELIEAKEEAASTTPGDGSDDPDKPKVGYKTDIAFALQEE